MSEDIQRRLAAILAADVAGYSRLMGEDETGTLSALRHLRTEQFVPTVDRHRGKIVKSMGDGWLVEFASVVDAVTCAIEVQEGLAGHESIKIRVGVHLGDITHEEEDIFGDGVNIAARLQEIAEPGGIVISDIARRSIDGKLAAAFVDLGVQDLKNIAAPVAAYGWGMTTITAEATVLPLPDKPSIAVLPFTNMSGDPEQEYFSDGVTDDIITALSRFEDLFVIARTSSFSFRGKAEKVQKIADDLGVRYVLEGGLRTAGKRIRINTQLIDAESGHHIWADRFDRDLEDVFALQDEISQKVASTVAGRLRITAQERARHKPTHNLQAYDYLLRGRSIVGDTEDNNLRAKRAYQKAIELDPACARAYMGLSQHYMIDEFSNWGQSPEQSRELALECVEKAVALDKFDCEVQWRAGFAYTCRGEFEEARIYLTRALELNSNDADALTVMGVYLTAIGKASEAVDCCERAIKLNPFGPGYYLWNLATAYYCAREYEAVLVQMKEYVSRFPKFIRPRRVLAAAYAQLGRLEEARKETEIILAAEPNTSLKVIREKDTLIWKHQEDREHWLEGLKLAGFPA
jgi:TolB-like protein/tetratricopeptide (TPR) repeat protein